MKKLLAATAVAAALSGCMSDVPQTREEMPPQPSRAEITRVATEAYQQNRGKDPRNLSIRLIGADNYIGTNQWDYFACLSITETAEYQTYDNAGNLVRDIGDQYAKDYFLHLRYYVAGSTPGWGSGFLRPINSTTKVGRRHALELCPADQ